MIKLSHNIRTLLTKLLDNHLVVSSWGINDIHIQHDSIQFSAKGFMFNGNIKISSSKNFYIIELGSKTITTSIYSDVLTILDEAIEHSNDYAAIAAKWIINEVRKKSSGHAFEEMIKELATMAMGDSNIEFILQRDLNTLIKAGELANEPRDISWLREQVKGNIFDLFAVVTVNDKKYCFGCVQCKTSIRDRVTRDREPSIHAMESYFWSIVFVLDGSYLKNPKFQHMVNGGSQEFPENGWHAMYDISGQHNIGRIYPLELDFSTLRRHSEKAVNDWLKQRQWFNKDWKA